jgi:hypothetical protein
MYYDLMYFWGGDTRGAGKDHSEQKRVLNVATTAILTESN